MVAPHLSPWTQAGALVFVSGQLARDADRKISATDIDGQTTRAIRNIAHVLEGAGLTLADMIKTTVWRQNARDFAAFRAVPRS